MKIPPESKSAAPVSRSIAQRAASHHTTAGSAASTAPFEEELGAKPVQKKAAPLVSPQSARVAQLRAVVAQRTSSAPANRTGLPDGLKGGVERLSIG